MFYHESKGERDYCWRLTNNTDNNTYQLNVEEYAVYKKVLSDDIKMMYEFIEFKYFKKVMKRNNNIIE